MGLFNSLFSRAGNELPGREAHSSAVAGTGSSQSPEGRNTLRRELVHVVLRDTMRAHAIPSDWLTAMVLPLSGSNSRRGLHVLLVVRQGHEQMLAYVPAFQRSFFRALRKFDARALEWMAGLSWQFEGMADTVGAAALPPLTGATAPAALAASTGTALAAPAASTAADKVAAAEDESVQEDLRALFAIRDEALRAPDRTPLKPDFEPTQRLE